MKLQKLINIVHTYCNEQSVKADAYTLLIKKANNNNTQRAVVAILLLTICLPPSIHHVALLLTSVRVLHGEWGGGRIWSMVILLRQLFEYYCYYQFFILQLSNVSTSRLFTN